MLDYTHVYQTETQ